ncbi:phage baseplate plug family protein [Domibacillus aminovorans]|uniref:Cyanophage baseplate Pam3 plug gp18 domain-containing protein n=1 Tax=Domibacillus aminovorans TaxID=29332 RepID=A0A177L9I7_9BACI|nr:hypothetical protein [Domibacillus aminovorans]OAH53076.1 hypothetical protein AWH48_12010 [Domibacillus aminovorans]OAH61952.1 hypothetical protein AWH49_11050 [Domibacillus aminovorans]
MIYIPIEKDYLPEEFEIQLAGEQFVLGINYNESFDFFTVDLYDAARNPIALGEKMILGQYLWQDQPDARLPAPALLPIDTSGKEGRITFGNLMVTTFLTIDSEVDVIDES